MSEGSKFRLQGWPIVAYAAVIVILCSVGVWLITTDPVQQVRAVIRVTARTSVTLFLLAFTASALWQFWPNAWTRWQRQNRRYLGVSFAVSHAIHLAAILMLGQVAPAELAREADIVTVIFGGLAYLFIAAMTLTSFDRTAAAIGPRAWKILHTVGSYYIWLIFANSYVSRAVMDTGYLPMAAIVVGALALRIVAAVAKARSRQALPEKGQTA